MAKKQLDPYQQNDSRLVPKDDESQTLDPYQQNDPRLIKYPGAKPAQRNYNLIDVPGAAMHHLEGDAEKFYGNVGRTLTHPIESTEKAIDLVKGVPGGINSLIGGSTLNALTPEVRAMIIQQNPEQLQAMSDAANRVGNPIGAVFSDLAKKYGGYENIKRTMAEHPIEFAADFSTAMAGVPGLTKAALTPVLGKAGATAAGAAVSKVATPLSKVINPLSSDNALMRLGRWGANKVGLGDMIPTRNGTIRATANFLNPQEAMLMKASEGQATPIINNLRPNSAVPGSIPNASQAVAGSSDATPFHALQIPADKIASTQAKRVEAAQNAARIAHLNSIANDPAEFKAAFNNPSNAITGSDAAIAERNAEAKRNYGISDRVMMNHDQDLHDLMDLPLTKSAFDDSRTAATQDGRDWQVGNNIPATTGTPATYNTLGMQTAPAVPPAPEKWAQMSGETGQDIKRRLDAMVFKASNEKASIDPDLIRMRNTRNDFVDWMESKNDPYRVARERYSLQSGIIDRQDVRDQLKAALSIPLMGDDIAAQRGAAYGAAMDNATNAATKNPIIKRATGQARNNHISDVFTPDEMGKAEAVKSDFTNEATANDLAKAGSSEYSSALTNAATAARLPGVFGPKDPTLNALAKMVTGKADERIAKNVSNAMQNPADAAAIMNKANNWDNSVKGVQAGADKLGNAMSKYPSVYDVLGAPNDVTGSADNYKADPNQPHGTVTVGPIRWDDPAANQGRDVIDHPMPDVEAPTPITMQEMVQPNDPQGGGIPTNALTPHLNDLAPENQDNVMARFRQAMQPQVQPDPAASSMPLAPGQQGPGVQQMGPPVPQAQQPVTNAMIPPAPQPTPTNYTNNGQWHMPIAHAAATYHVPVSVIDSVMKHESGGNASSKSPVGAIGLMQLMPGTAKDLGVNPYDTTQNIMGGAKYLKQMYDQFHSWPLAIAAYNAGPGAVQSHGGIPPYHETQNYVKNILADIQNRYGGIK